MLHAAGGQISKGRTPDGHRPRKGGLVRSVQRNLCRCRGGRVCSVAAWPIRRPAFVDSGSAVRPGNRASLYAGSWVRSWNGAGHPADADFTPFRCADRRRGRVTLQRAFRCHCRNLGRSACIDVYGDQTSGVTGRGNRGSLLADPAWWHRRSECRAGPLARRLVALISQSRRCKVPRRAALAAGVVPVTRQTARNLDGTI